MEKNIHNILIIGSINSKTNVDLTNSIYRTCKILNKLKYKVILVTENPVSILTNDDCIDELIISKITSETVNQIIDNHKIDAVIPTLGDRNAMSIIAEDTIPGNVKILGSTNLTALSTFNRDVFSKHLEYNNLPVINYISTKNEDEIYDFVRKNEFPVILRRRFKNRMSSGWSNIENLYDLNNFIERDPDFSDAVEIEKSIRGHREFSITTLRDRFNNTNVVGIIEDIQPIGIHHLDSLLLTPALTLTNTQIQELRNAAIKVAKTFNMVGVCTTHFALNAQNSNEFYITEIIPRLSEETQFLESAYNYPISEVAAQLNVGMTIDKLTDEAGKKFNAAYEPNIEHLTVRVPTWSNIQETTMEPKKTSNGAFIMRANNIGEVFKKGPLNAQITQTNVLNSGNYKLLDDDELFEKIVHPTNRQLSILKIALNRGFDIPYLSSVTNIHPVYLETLHQLSKLILNLVRNKGNIEILRCALISGFSINEIATLWKINEEQLEEMISQADIHFQLKDSSFTTNDNKSLDFIPSIGRNSEFVYDDTRETIVIKTSPEMSFTDQVRNNYLISRIAESGHKNGFNTIQVGRTTRETLNIDDNKMARIVDPFDEISRYNLLPDDAFKYSISLTNKLNDKNGLLDEGETKIFEDSSLKSIEEYEFNVLHSEKKWVITSCISTNISEKTTLASSKMKESLALKQLIQDFIDKSLTIEQQKFAKILNFTICFINDEIKIKKVSIGFSDNIIEHDIVSSLDLIDTYVKLVVGISFEELNLDVNEFGFINTPNTKEIAFDNDSFTLLS